MYRRLCAAVVAWALSILMCVECSAGSSQLPPIKGGPDPYSTTTEYNTFPWNFEMGRAYILQVGPLSEAPSNPPAYAGYPILPGFSGGNGQIGLLQYTKSPIGSYNEIMYGPGNYAPGCGAASPLNSIQRIWVDSVYSQAAGRNIWGIPKEMANFEWTESADWTSVRISDPTTGKVFFQATLADIPIPQFLVDKGLSLLSGIIPDCLTTLQWPIDDNTGRTQHATVPAYAIAQQAKGSNAQIQQEKSGNPMRMLQSQTCFSMSGSAVVKVIGAWADPAVFIGRPYEQVSIVPIGFRLPAGTPATFTAPTILQC